MECTKFFNRVLSRNSKPRDEKWEELEVINQTTNHQVLVMDTDGADTGCLEDSGEDAHDGKFTFFKETKEDVTDGVDCDENDTIEVIPTLFSAIELQDVNLVREQLNSLNEGEINELQYAKQMPIHVVCRIKNMSILKLLLDSNAKITVKDGVGNTPLHVAVEEAWFEGARLLMLHGASADSLSIPPTTVKGIVKETPLCRAVRLGNYEMVKLILDFQPDMTVKDSKNRTLLHVAAFCRSLDILELLLQSEVMFKYINDVDINSNTPLHSLVLSGVECKDDIIIQLGKRFIEIKVDIDARTKIGETVLFLAAKSKFCSFLQMLLKCGADPSITTTDNRSVLHAASQAGCHSCLKALLETELLHSYVSTEDNLQCSPFHYAVQSLSIDCCELLIKNGDHLTKLDSNGVSRCSILLDKVPSAITLLTRLMDSHITVSDHKDFDADLKIDFDYSMIISKSSDHVQSSLISELNTSCLENLLKHPLLESFLFTKWQLIRYFFYTNVFMYFIFLVLHTYYVTNTYGNMPNYWNQHTQMLVAVRIIHVIMFVIIFIPDILILLGNFVKFLKHWETYLKVVILSTSAFVVFSPEATNEINEMSVEVEIAAISVLLSWIEFMLLLGRFPYFGSSILMLTKVSSSIIKFLIAFSSLIIGFAISFSILFKHLHVFKNFPNSLVKTLMMMIGEIDYGDIVSNENYNSTVFKNASYVDKTLYYIITKVLLSVFLFLVPILLANLLIGLAVNDIPDLQRQGKIKRLSKQSSYLVSYEKLMHFFKSFRLFPRFIRIIMERKTRIEEKITIFPNKQASKNTKTFNFIPNETVQAAIIVKKQEDETFKDEDDNADVSIDKQFKTFRRMYRCDRRQINNHFKKISGRLDNQNIASLHEQLQEIQASIDRQNAIIQNILSPKLVRKSSLNK